MINLFFNIYIYIEREREREREREDQRSMMNSQGNDLLRQISWQT